MSAYNSHIIVLFISLILLIQKTSTNGEDKEESRENHNEQKYPEVHQHNQRNDSPSDVIEYIKHSRVKRQFYPYPYYGLGYYRRPLPIIVGGIGFGGVLAFGGRGFGGRGFGGRGFGGRGFGGRGFGGRGFGGRGIGGRGGFGGRGRG